MITKWFKMKMVYLNCELIVKCRAIIISKRRELITKKQLFLLFRLKVLKRFAIFSGEYVNPYFFEERRVQ
jgi:hypothetical protein